MSLLPYMLSNGEKFTAYIPFSSTNSIFSSFTSVSAAQYLGLPMDRKEYNPSYFFTFKNEHEIGIIGSDKIKMLDAIREIQQKLKIQNCTVNENFSSAEEIIIK